MTSEVFLSNLKEVWNMVVWIIEIKWDKKTNTGKLVIRKKKLGFKCWNETFKTGQVLFTYDCLLHKFLDVLIYISLCTGNSHKNKF